MRSNNPWFSPIGLVMTTATLLGVLLAIWSRGLTIFSPGEISARSSRPSDSTEYQNHADFENACQRCHQPLETIQATLCLNCHTSVNNQIIDKEGTHGLILAMDQCSKCHPDHRGRDFDLLSLGVQSFDHSATDFDLIHHQVSFDSQPMNCHSCHADGRYDNDIISCVECHFTHNSTFMTAHQINYGEDCLACHDGLDSMDSFNHNVETDFPLLGAHLLITCSDCHESGSFHNLSADCAACHQEPVQHVGLFEQNCASCHTSDAWSPATFGETNFSHQDSTRFSLVHHALDFSGSPMTCASCHQGEGWRSPPQICLDCHIEQEPIEINQHFSEFGPRCLDCHDGRDRMQNFDHGSYFLLEGKHADVTCDICHQEQVWVDTNPTCISCHEEPELHLGVFGRQCQYCHISEGWVPAPLRRHPFPLEHGGDTASTCETCHQEIYSAYSCYSCHEHDQGEIESGHTAAGIDPDEVSSCYDCHKNGEIEESR